MPWAAVQCSDPATHDTQRDVRGGSAPRAIGSSTSGKQICAHAHSKPVRLEERSRVQGTGYRVQGSGDWNRGRRGEQCTHLHSNQCGY